MKINNHRLTNEIIEQVSCPKNKVPLAKKYPDSIIIHYTADARNNGEKALNWLKDSGSNSSAHILISRDASVIWQMVPFNIKAWHAGRSSYGGRSAYNNYSIGIEMANEGELTREGDKFYTWYGREIPFHEVYRDASGYWHMYTGDDIQLAYQVCQVICQHYGIKQILGHEEISPGRKSDPGPAFPMTEFRQDLQSFLTR